VKYHHYFELAASLTGLITFRKHWPAYAKALLVLAGVTFGIELYAQYLWSNLHKQNHFLYNLFLPFQCFVVLFAFSRLLINNSLLLVNRMLIAVFFTGTVAAYIYYPTFVNLNYFASTLYLVLMIIASGCFFLDIAMNSINVPLIRQPVFWLATGILVFSVTFVIRMAFWTYLASLPNINAIIFVTNIISNIFFYGGLIGFFICLRQTTYSSPSS